MHKAFLFIWILIAACANPDSSNQENDQNLEVDSIPVEELIESDSVLQADQDTFDTSFDLYSVNKLGFGPYYLEFIPLSERLLTGEIPKQAIVPPSLLGPNAHKELDTIYNLAGKYRAAALLFAGVEETDSVFIFNLNQNKVLTCRVSDLPMIALINPYGPNNNVTQLDYVFGLDILGLKNRKQKNYLEQELVSIHTSNPFIRGGVQPIEWVEIDSNTYPKSIKKIEKRYTPDRCFYYQYEDFDIYGRVYTSSNRPTALKIDVLKNGHTVFSTTAATGEGSDPILPMLDDQSYYANWTGRLFRDLPPIIYGIQSLSFGCSQVHFIQKEAYSKYIFCDNRH